MEWSGVGWGEAAFATHRRDACTTKGNAPARDARRWQKCSLLIPRASGIANPKPSELHILCAEIVAGGHLCELHCCAGSAEDGFKLGGLIGRGHLVESAREDEGVGTSERGKRRGRIGKHGAQKHGTLEGGWMR